MQIFDPSITLSGLPQLYKTVSYTHLKEGITALGGVQGLCVRVENGRKTFIFRYTFQKKKREVTIGSYPVMSLSEAREKAMGYRRLLSEEVDPKEWRDRQREEKIENERKKELAELKFSTVADRYLCLLYTSTLAFPMIMRLTE